MRELPEPSNPSKLSNRFEPSIHACAGEPDLTAVFAKRRGASVGSWLPGRHIDVLAVFGDVIVDFTAATLAPGVTVVDLTVTCAVARLIVPIGLAVTIDTQLFFASLARDSRIDPGMAAVDDDEPSLHLTGHILFGRLDLRLGERF